MLAILVALDEFAARPFKILAYADCIFRRFRPGNSYQPATHIVFQVQLIAPWDPKELPCAQVNHARGNTGSAATDKYNGEMAGKVSASFQCFADIRLNRPRPGIVGVNLDVLRSFPLKNFRRKILEPQSGFL